MRIKALLFDIGGVLYRIVDIAHRRKWERLLGLSDGQLAEIVFTNPVARRATVGQATPEDVWREVGQRFFLSGDDLTMLRDDFWKGGEWDMELLDFICSIKPDYKTGTLSDAWWDARNNLKQFINGENFDVIVFSAEEGLKKPDTEIYLITLKRLGVDPQEAIFVDDRLPNVVGAQQVGMHTVQHKKTNRTINAILQLLCLGT